MVIRHDGQARSALEICFRDPASHRFGHPAKLGIGATLDLIVALEFERNIVRPALLALDKAVVKSGHGSMWNIHEKVTTAETAGMSRGKRMIAPTVLGVLSAPGGEWLVSVLLPPIRRI